MSGVLIDTSVWIDHFRRSNTALIQLVVCDQVMTHPLIIGEVACGTPPNRKQLLDDLGQLQQVKQATIPEALGFVEQEKLFGLGCGFVDVLLLASTILTPDTRLWSLDKRLCSLADRFKVGYRPALH